MSHLYRTVRGNIQERGGVGDTRSDYTANSIQNWGHNGPIFVIEGILDIHEDGRFFPNLVEFSMVNNSRYRKNCVSRF